MKKKELLAFKDSNYLYEGYPEVLQMARPLFEHLIHELSALPETSSEQEKLKCFEKCVVSLNQSEDDIETVEREVFCDALYRIGNIVGLDEKSGFVDNWRQW